MSDRQRGGKARVGDLGPLLDQTVPPMRLQNSRTVKAASRKGVLKAPEPVPPLIAEWKRDQALARAGRFRRWMSSHVAGYRVELIDSYFWLTLFGVASIVVGVPIFNFTTPVGWTPIWGASVVVGGLVAMIGATHAGEETQVAIKVFNRIELAGTVILTVALHTFGVILLLLGMGLVEAPSDPATPVQNLGRIAVGIAIFGLASHPRVRMIWLFFRPGKILTIETTHRFRTAPTATDVGTGPSGVVK
jgi:hypothetical protein